MPDTKSIFISYAHEDAPAARRIAEALRGFGMNVLFDEEELRGGDAWDAKLRKQIRECTLFMPIISAQTEERVEGYFRREWKLACNRIDDLATGVAFLLPVVIDDTPEYGSAVPESFTQVQWIRLQNGEPTPEFVSQVKRLFDAPRKPIPAGTGHSDRPESTPGGVSQSAADQEAARISRRNKVIGLVALVAVISIIGSFVWNRRDATSGPTRGVESSDVASDAVLDISAKSIAVLPFENRSNREEDLFFADGVHGDLLMQISKIRDIKTISRTSVMTYRDSSKRLTEIAEELGVATILEGGVQRSGQQVRINVQLRDANTEEELWTESFNRELTAENVLSIQSEIAKAVADSLQILLSDEEMRLVERVLTTNQSALEAYYQGNAHRSLKTVAGLENAVAYFEKAVLLDPDFALAHARLARTYLAQIWRGRLSVSSRDQIEKAESHVLRAIELDDTLSEAYTALGSLRSRQGELEAARRAYEKAVALNPNDAEALKAYAAFLDWTYGDSEKAGDFLKRAHELDPKGADSHFNLARSFFVSDRFDEAIIEYRSALALDPHDCRSASDMAWSYLSLDDLSLARWWAGRALGICAQPSQRANLHIITGDFEAMIRLALEALTENPQNHGMLWHITNASIATGAPEKALVHWRRIHPDLFSPSVEITASDIWNAKNLSRILMATGETEHARKLIEKAFAAGPTPVQEFQLYAALGDEGNAVKVIRRYLEGGGSFDIFTWQRVEIGHFLQNPEILEITKAHRAELARQLDRIHKMEAIGGLAPMP